MGRAAGGGDDPTEDSEASKNKPSEEPREGREGRSEKPSPYDKFAEGVRIAKLRNVAAGRLRRRSSMRGAMDLAVSLRGEPRGKEDGERNGQGKTKEEKLKEDVSGAVATTAFAVAAGATLLRVGGRAALLSVAGLDFMQDSGLKDQVGMSWQRAGGRVTNTAESAQALALYGFMGHA